MLRLFTLALILLCSSSCSLFEDKNNPTYLEPPCPLVTLQDTEYTVLVQHKDAYQIILTGYYGDCYLSRRKYQSYAIIQPIFTIRRLEAGDQTNVPFNFYVSASAGPVSGQFYRHYHEIATLPEFDKETRYVGSKITVPLPDSVKYSYNINLGLEIEPKEQIYNNRYFNEHFDYSEDTFNHAY